MNYPELRYIWEKVSHRFGIDGTVLLVVVDSDVAASGGFEKLAIEVIDLNTRPLTHLAAEGTCKSVAQEDAQLLVEDIGLGGLHGVCGGEYQHIGKPIEGFAPLAAVAGLDCQHHATVHVGIVHLGNYVADKAVPKSFSGVFVSPKGAVV